MERAHILHHLHGDDPNLQYGWTLFVNPINKSHGWSIASIQFAFALFIALETWLTPIEGWIVDSLGAERGPKIMVAFGGAMVAIGWAINAKAKSLSMLYFGSVVAGVGGGAVYATSIGLAVKWFPDRRGLAVGSPPQDMARVRLSLSFQFAT